MLLKIKNKNWGLLMSEVLGGYCGKNVKWELNSKGVLRIYGEGSMEIEYINLDLSQLFENKVKKIVVEPRVTRVVGLGSLRHLTSITFSDGLREIASLSYYGCKRLRSVVLPEGIKYIGSLAFSHCSKLESINIPNSIEYIGDNAFDECPLVLNEKMKNKAAL